MSIQDVGSIGELIATIENLVGQQSLDLGYSDLDSTSALDLLAPVVRALLETEAGARGGERPLHICTLTSSERRWTKQSAGPRC